MIRPLFDVFFYACVKCYELSGYGIIQNKHIYFLVHIHELLFITEVIILSFKISNVDVIETVHTGHTPDLKT